tara:strand:+ start:113 stop:337 length:225 start_codon:yes stop_codon:yes gene_type:complete
MVKWINNRIKVLFIVSFFTFVGVAVGQDLTIENFTIPICANGNGEDYLNFYESFNGEYNNCNYRVVFATLFCSW